MGWVFFVLQGVYGLFETGGELDQQCDERRAKGPDTSPESTGPATTSGRATTADNDTELRCHHVVIFYRNLADTPLFCFSGGPWERGNKEHTPFPPLTYYLVGIDTQFCSEWQWQFDKWSFF